MQGVQKTLKPQKVRGVVQWERKQRAVVGAATFRMSGPQPTVVHGQQALFWWGLREHTSRAPVH